MKPTRFTPPTSATKARSGPIRRTLQLVSRTRPASDALEVVLLGSDHPLVQVSDLLQSINRQCFVVATILLGATVAVIERQDWAWMLILGAGFVLSIDALLAVGFRQCKRDHAIDLILNGYQNIPIAAIQDQRQRLLSERTRKSLARVLMRTVEEVSERPRWKTRGTMALYHPKTIADAIDELLAVASALQTDDLSAQGIARAERLLTNGTSPFYGHDQIALRAELRRIRDDLLAQRERAG